jgi:hypothetical protein
MNMATLSIAVPEVNPERLISKVRRIAKRHGLRLVKDRTKPSHGYKLQSAGVIGESLTLEEALRICNQLDGAR